MQKSLGFFTINTGRNMSHTILRIDTLLNFLMISEKTDDDLRKDIDNSTSRIRKENFCL